MADADNSLSYFLCLSHGRRPFLHLEGWISDISSVIRYLDRQPIWMTIPVHGIVVCELSFHVITYLPLSPNENRSENINPTNLSPAAPSSTPLANPIPVSNPGIIIKELEKQKVTKFIVKNAVS